jgi:quercetin dioxygenase-like cupin family protein
MGENMKNAKLALVTTASIVALISTFGVQSLRAQQPGFSRTILQKADISAPGRETVQVRAEFDAGAGTGKHTHPGEEVGYVLDGQFAFAVEGKPPVTLKAGDHFFVPAGTVHEGRNAGSGKAKVLVTYIVEKGKPLATSVK